MALKLLAIATFVMSLILAVAVHVVWIVSYVGARCLGANPEITLITLGHACPVCKNEVERARAK